MLEVTQIQAPVQTPFTTHICKDLGPKCPCAQVSKVLHPLHALHALHALHPLHPLQSQLLQLLDSWHFLGSHVITNTQPLLWNALREALKQNMLISHGQCPYEA